MSIADGHDLAGSRPVSENEPAPPENGGGSFGETSRPISGNEPARFGGRGRQVRRCRRLSDGFVAFEDPAERRQRLRPEPGVVEEDQFIGEMLDTGECTESADNICQFIRSTRTQPFEGCTGGLTRLHFAAANEAAIKATTNYQSDPALGTATATCVFDL
mgnify:CR=1 FL=1